MNWVRISDEVTADADYFVTAARPNTSATMAQTTLAAAHNGGGRNVTVTTTGSGDGGKTATITGTDTDGAAQTEVITLAGSATAVAGTKIFLTVTAVEMSSQPAANITVGFGAVADAVINETGKIIGVNMKDFGIGYTEAPYVTMIDDCDNGKGATGVACMDGDKVMNICILDGGGGYLSEGVSDSEGVDVIGEVNDINIISTGIGYEEGDLIVSDSGQTLTPIIEDGRIVGVDGKIDQGLTDIPALSIITNTGFGAKILPVTRFVKREEYTDPVVPDAQLVRVISCPRFY